MATACDGNGGPKTKIELERRDLLKAVAAVVGITIPLLGAAVVLAMYVFLPRAEAAIKYAAIEQAAALHAQEVSLRREFSEAKVKAVEKEVADTKLIVQTVYANQKGFMHDMGARRAKKLPPSVDVDFGELGQ